MNDIWNEAPEGATHYQPQQQAFYADMGGEKWMIWARNLSGLLCWQPSTGTVRDCLIPAPSEATWTGEGLPPVGAVCECQDESFKWKPGTIVYVGQGDGAMVAVMQADSGILIGEKGEFRPLRTPEQIAAEEREKEVDALCSDIVSHYEAPKMSEHYLGLAKALHAAGYRKVTP